MRSAFLRFVVGTTLIAAVLGGIGLWPTRRLAGSAGVPALAAGIGIGLAASWIGAVLPLALLPRRLEGNAAAMVLAGTGIRTACALLPAVALALTRSLPVAPLLLWVALSYVALLPADVWFAVSRLKRPSR